ncbi:GPI-anchored protein LLG1-like [Lolium rigidum]|uniref:GPI-anchored protein LLG1-like n=1 Tax=Lolium rigidum TaxID=89674 RepID=UPI001F5D0E45|nr:GPI-anchored protein LLG1-like [Lolium rigidum]
MRFLLCLFAAVVAGATTVFISSVGADVAVLLAHDIPAATGRSRTLLQDGRKACPVNLAAANYTVLTSRCRWPPFDPLPCCAAFKDLACPYTDYINDVNGNDCAITLFRYIRLHGGYPPGVFYENCKEGPKGLKCPDDQGTL